MPAQFGYFSLMGINQTGRLHAKFEPQQITERFRKQEFVVELEPNSRYPQYVSFQLTGDRCGQIDGYQVGDEISVEFTLRGREWTSPQGEVKYFNSLEVWGIEGQKSQAPVEDFAPPGQPPPDLDDDVPF
jgi:hypothetical protein